MAAHPVAVRDESRLCVVGQHSLEHVRFRGITRYLVPGDVLVLNDSRVLRARLRAIRPPGGGAVEVLLLQPTAGWGAEWSSERDWLAMVRPGRKVQEGTQLLVGGETWRCRGSLETGERLLRFEGASSIREHLENHGQLPLPPYILAQREHMGECADASEDDERYQTVYCAPEGSVAAPTAGLHFTTELLEQVRSLGVEIHRVTLHVGPGTFRPIQTRDVRDHPMHEEAAIVDEATARAITAAKAAGRRVVAVGTTATRVLESAATAVGVLGPLHTSTQLMIAPGHQFRIVDGLVTNFHLPRSTLLLLVAALTGRERLLAIYREAIDKGYRFYSYGDAMFILPQGAAGVASTPR